MKWLAFAETIPLGQHRRIPCPNDCGTDKSVIVNHNSDYYHAGCFRCDFKEYHWKGYQTLAQLQHIQEMNNVAKEQTKHLSLPEDTSYDESLWPTEARLWLYQASIYGARRESASIGYSAKSGRIVLPVYQEGKLSYYQLRRIFGDQPKYLGPSIDREHLLYWRLPNVEHPRLSRRCVVLVEDILSCIRVGEHIPCASLLGTKMSTQQAAALAQYETVITWLDSDLAGVTGAVAIRRALSLVCNTDNILTSNDPKLLSNSEINFHIKEAGID